MDLDWVSKDHKKLLILSHGLEGSSQSKYIQGMINYFSGRNFDALAWNCRGCSGEDNLKLQPYHSGMSSDLELVIQHAMKKYDQIYLIGFSMGGNITLKYLGENSDATPKEIKGACAFSAPVDLKSASAQLSKGFSKVYGNRFLVTLKQKMLLKKELFIKENIDINNLKKIKTIVDFDNYFTAPMHNFIDGDDYYHKSSSLNFLPQIKTPTLIVNALNDPFLGETCYPHPIASKNSFLTLETPKTGGHVAFCSRSKDGSYWSEQRAYSFLSQI